jgi:hypothetical protein
MRNYLKYLRRQPKYVQHVHAFVFAGVITALIAAFILYYDYGFWHEKYQKGEDEIAVQATTTEIESPSKVLINFFSEAKKQFGNIGSSSASLLEGKETYTREEN